MQLGQHKVYELLCRGVLASDYQTAFLFMAGEHVQHVVLNILETGFKGEKTASGVLFNGGSQGVYRSARRQRRCRQVIYLLVKQGVSVCYDGLVVVVQHQGVDVIYRPMDVHQYDVQHSFTVQAFMLEDTAVHVAVTDGAVNVTFLQLAFRSSQFHQSQVSYQLVYKLGVLQVTAMLQHAEMVSGHSGHLFRFKDAFMARCRTVHKDKIVSGCKFDTVDTHVVVIVLRSQVQAVKRQTLVLTVDIGCQRVLGYSIFRYIHIVQMDGQVITVFDIHGNKVMAFIFGT